MCVCGQGGTVHTPFLSTLWHFCCCRKDFEVCSSGLSCLSQVSAHLQGLESLFILPGMKVEQTDQQMALVESLEYVRGEIRKATDDFTTWKTHLLRSGSQGGKDCYSVREKKPSIGMVSYRQNLDYTKDTYCFILNISVQSSKADRCGWTHSSYFPTFVRVPCLWIAVMSLSL